MAATGVTGEAGACREGREAASCTAGLDLHQGAQQRAAAAVPTKLPHPQAPTCKATAVAPLTTRPSSQATTAGLVSRATGAPTEMLAA